MEELLIQNEWWERGEISKEKAKVYHRKVYKKALDTFSKYRQILVLTGLRRTGKTTIMYQIIDDLIKRGIDPKKILYFSKNPHHLLFPHLLASMGRSFTIPMEPTVNNISSIVVRTVRRTKINEAQ